MVRGAYSIDCAVLALLSLLAAWKPSLLVKLLFIWKKEVPVWTERAFRFVALLFAAGAITAIVLRIVEKGG